VLSRVVGPVNVCAPTLAGLGTNFGLWPLIARTLAIVSDARLSGRTDQAIVTERLLSISGEDSLTIDRKNRELVTTKLTTRIMLLSNELPRLADASGALANRFVILTLRKSYLGAEDTGLTDRLTAEVPSIAAWALDGLRRLRDEGRFTEPAAGDDLRQELNDLASPIGAFIRECCHVRPGVQVECGEIFAAWCAWCDEQGNKHAGTLQTFGRDLRAALPGIGGRNLRDGDTRTRVYTGIDLTAESQFSAQKWRSERSGTRSDPVHA
jgi:putative DNA primase/helicase